jgi:deoxyribodipyrimidine photo-lyase
MINLFWFRRDLRLTDNCGLYHALRDGLPVLPVFIFDKNILEKLQDPSDARITFIYDEVARLKSEIEKTGSSLLVIYGDPETVFRELAEQYKPVNIFANHDYEPYALNRDNRIGQLLKEQGIAFNTFKDQVIFEKDEVVKDNGEPYTVFTPYSRKWKSHFDRNGIRHFASEELTGNFLRASPLNFLSLPSIGFNRSAVEIPPREINTAILENYSRNRDFPAIRGTSRLGIHLRFGTVSIRKLVAQAAIFNEVYLNELIWREFYMMILWHFPHVAEQAFKPQYDRIPWQNDENLFKAWFEGKTGYPIVDAGMRELKMTGYMHNRVRMITASFLAKHLLIDWRWGEAYFAGKLLDFELASNNGGWQWAAGTGCDAAPYFRVFNPALQAEKFDPELKYTRKWVPELDSSRYPGPVVDHATARKRAISTYKKTLEKNI